MRFAACFLVCLNLAAQGLPDSDQRYAAIRHLDATYEMAEYSSAAEWLAHADYLRQQILWSTGLDPLPERTPLHPQLSGRLERDGYSVENVLIETAPGFFLGGNLYRPSGSAESRPAVLLSHGHWTYGRLENSEIASPPTLAANLALQGHIVFTYDMVGYNDTLQLPHAAFGGEREALWNVNLLGLQLWNSMRALDFLSSLSGVDASRIYAAGASGGATQAMLLTAVDKRISAAAFVNMISFHMQGGDVCENAPGLRIDTHNVEIAALAAPRPLLLVSASGDWTANTPNREFPAIQHIYDLLGQKGRVETVQFNAPHNFNRDSREAVYAFLSRQGSNPQQTVIEKRVAVPQVSQLLSLWNHAEPGPAKFDIASLPMRRAADPNATPQDVRRRLQLTLHAVLPSPEELQSQPVDAWPNGEYFALGRSGKGDRIPGALIQPKRPREWVKPTLVIHPEGSAWTMSSSESRRGYVAEILSRGGAVMAVDVFNTGHVRGHRDVASAGPRAEAFFSTYNRSDTAQRVQDILTAFAYAQQRFATNDVQLVCLDAAGPWCALARALIAAPVDMAIDWHNFDAGSDEAYLESLFVPGIRRAGGVESALSLAEGGRLLVFNAAGFPTAAAPLADVNEGALDPEFLLEWTAAKKRPSL
jgi:dienelactone hydrolase